MQTLQEIKDRITILGVKHNTVKWVGMGAFTYAGMQNLSDFVGDIAQLLPALIPLIIVVVIIAVVYKFGGYIESILSLKKKK